MTVVEAPRRSERAEGEGERDADELYVPGIFVYFFCLLGLMRIYTENLFPSFFFFYATDALNCCLSLKCDAFDICCPVMYIY